MTTLRASDESRRAAAAAAVLALLAACNRSERAAVLPAPPSAGALAAAESGPVFLPPPLPTSAQRLAGGEVEVAGRAPPGAQVSLRNPDGQALTVPADRDGTWSFRLPAAAVPRLYALSGVVGGRTLRGEGALLQAPAPAAPALLLRAGAPSLSLDRADDALVFEAADFDGAGGLAISGRAPPRAALRLSLDGRPSVAGQSDAQGRFALMAVQGDLKPGLHLLRLEGAGRTVEMRVDAAPAALAGRPYEVRRVEGGWRVDWATPGGGVQSSVVFAPGLPGAAS